MSSRTSACPDWLGLGACGLCSPPGGPDHARVLANLRGRSGRHLSSEVEDHEGIADAQDETHVMVDQDHRHAVLLRQRAEPVAGLDTDESLERSEEHTSE